MADRQAQATAHRLVRIPAEAFVAGSPDDDAETLAQAAGYGVLRQKLGTVDPELARTLATLEIPAYTTASVDAYMTEELERVTPHERIKVWARLHLLCWIAGVTGALVAIGAMALASAFGPIEGPVDFYAFWGGIALCIACLIGGLIVNAIRDELPLPRWETGHLCNYQGELPAEIAARAAKVVRALPEAKFFVSTLGFYYQPSAFDDPFLWVEHKGCRICIGWWDEPRYEAVPLG